jgi:Uma2 family endonuclease
MAIRQPKPGPIAEHPSRFQGVRRSAQQFLALPEEKPYLEYIDGRVEQKPMVNAAHRRVVRRLDALFDEYIETLGGDAGPEGRVALRESGDYLLPDTAYWAPGTPSGDDSLPTLAVEVRSPGQSLQSLRSKALAYLRNGVHECWLIDPEKRTVQVFTPGATRTLKAGDSLASTAMPAFELDLASLFALLDS